MTPTTDRVWSPQQQAIFKRVRIKKPKKPHTLIRARAGTGKTTTIIKALEFIPANHDVLVAAFNASIAKELTDRVKDIGLSNVKAMTLHSIGYRIVLKAWGNIRLLKDEVPSRADYLTAMVAPGIPSQIARLISTLHTKAREILPYADAWTQLEELAWKFECIPNHHTYDEEFVCRMAINAMALAADEKLVKLRGMDFSDMIFLPLRCGLLTRMYDDVFVDEAQDMTAAQLEIALGVCRGRVYLVGDDRQGIYAFRGADTRSLDRLKVELDAEELNLTTTYRCGKVIVAYAKRLVPDFEAGPNNPEGVIQHATREQMRTRAVPGDFILSRKNAPLVSIAIGLLRDGKRARIKGRDIGKGLMRLVDTLAKKSESVSGFLDVLDTWHETECERWIAAERPDRVMEVEDKYGMIRELAGNAETVDDVRDKIEFLFTDDGTGAAGVITCSSIHRAKGLEADTVYVLADTLYAGSDAQEEANLEYVAVTRAKNTLVFVTP